MNTYRSIERTSDNECAICFINTNNTVVPCRHSICEQCMEKWYEQKQCIRCPVCRQNLHSFSEKAVHDADLVLFCRENDHYGITLKICNKGVVVTRAVKQTAIIFFIRQDTNEIRLFKWKRSGFVD